MRPDSSQIATVETGKRFLEALERRGDITHGTAARTIPTNLYLLGLAVRFGREMIAEPAAGELPPLSRFERLDVREDILEC